MATRCSVRRGSLLCWLDLLCVDCGAVDWGDGIPNHVLLAAVAIGDSAPDFLALGQTRDREEGKGGQDCNALEHRIL